MKNMNKMHTEKAKIKNNFQMKMTQTQMKNKIIT